MLRFTLLYCERKGKLSSRLRLSLHFLLGFSALGFPIKEKFYLEEQKKKKMEKIEIPVYENTRDHIVTCIFVYKYTLLRSRV